MANGEPNIDQVAAVTELIAPGTAEAATSTEAGTLPLTDGQPAADPQSGDDPGTDELTPTILAEKLGMTPQALFKSLKIPVDGGEPLTLEQFKDAGKELRGVTDAQAALAEKRVAFENETMTQRQTLSGMLAKIPPELLTDELVAGVQVEHQVYVEGERAALLAIRPDLSEPAKWTGVRSMIVEHLRPYGFRDAEVDGIIDHRLAKYVIDNAERAIRVAELEKTVDKGAQPLKGRKPKPAAAGRREIKPRTGEPKIHNQGVMSQKVAQVAKLLGEN